MAAHAWELTKKLAARGNRAFAVTAVKFVTSKPRILFPRTEVKNGVTIVHLGAFAFKREKQIRWGYKRTLERIAAQSRSVPVMHAHELFAPSYFSSISTLPLVWTNHSSMFLNALHDTDLSDRLSRDVRLADRVTAPSMELLGKTIGLGYPPERATYVPNGVDIERFQPRTGQRPQVVEGFDGISELDDLLVVLVARRFTPKNGIHVFLDALEMLEVADQKQLCVLFAGNSNAKTASAGSYAPDMVERIRGLNGVVRCHLLGNVPNDAMPLLYRSSDVCVLPSLLEATSITGLEAMASGLPIIGSETGGIPEIVVDGETGLLTETGSAAGLAGKLVYYLRNRGETLRMGIAARKRAEAEFSWDRIGALFEQVYDSALIGSAEQR
jgi:glycosyltransferase involved in cell wall biosynthesis